MPYKVLWEEDCVSLEWSGKISYQENIEANGILYGNKHFENISFIKSNILEADLSGFNLKNITVIGKLDKQSAIWNKNLKAVHIATNKHTLELISHWEKTMEGSGWEFKVFSTIEAADKWISEYRKSI